MIRQPNRIQPAGPASAFQTYVYSRGRDTAIKASCQQVGCLDYARGWDTIIDERTFCGSTGPLDQCGWLSKGVPCGSCQGRYIRAMSGRTFKEAKTEAGLTVFRFDSHQRCFAEHKTVPERFYVRGGDWRQNQGLIRKHANGLDWAEDMSEKLDLVIAARQRG